MKENDENLNRSFEGFAKVWRICLKNGFGWDDEKIEAKIKSIHREFIFSPGLFFRETPCTYLFEPIVSLKLKELVFNEDIDPNLRSRVFDLLERSIVMSFWGRKGYDNINWSLSRKRYKRVLTYLEEKFSDKTAFDRMKHSHHRHIAW